MVAFTTTFKILFMFIFNFRVGVGWSWVVFPSNLARLTAKPIGKLRERERERERDRRRNKKFPPQRQIQFFACFSVSCGVWGQMVCNRFLQVPRACFYLSLTLLQGSDLQKRENSNCKLQLQLTLTIPIKQQNNIVPAIN